MKKKLFVAGIIALLGLTAVNTKANAQNIRVAVSVPLPGGGVLNLRTGNGNSYGAYYQNQYAGYANRGRDAYRANERRRMYGNGYGNNMNNNNRGYQTQQCQTNNNQQYYGYNQQGYNGPRRGR